MLKIVADQKIPFLKGALEPYARVVYLPPADITANRIKDADALIIRTRTRCDKRLLEGSSVRFIASATIGYDHIDTRWCEENNIRWTNAPGCNASSVVQYISAALSVISPRLAQPLHETTLGVIGVGNVGRRVERLADLLGMRILLHDPPREAREGNMGFASMEKLLAESDIVSLHVPLEQSADNNTRHMADTGFFSQMKKGAWFINTSRGEVTQSSALLETLENRKLEGAVLDVWEEEPHIGRELLKAAAIATPHIAGYSADGKANGTAMSVQAISKFFGLGLGEWYPENIPTTSHANINFSCSKKKRQDVFRELSLMTYDILSDSEKLKAKPESFERFREAYPIRREPAGYHIHAYDCSAQLNKFMLELGFGVSI